MDAYRDDLAYIHDTGHGDFAQRSAPAILAMLRRVGITDGRVVDLGCGSGIWGSELVAAGYDVLGVDISAAMIRLARQRVPRAKFRVNSYLAADLPPCEAVTALGECFSYLFDESNTRPALLRLFRRIHAALRPGGLLIFDMIGPGRVPGGGILQKHVAGDDWAALVDLHEDRERMRLTRRITTFRKLGGRYRRDYEVHCLRLEHASEVAVMLREIGFRVRMLRGYGRLRFVRGHHGFVARKP